MTTDLHDCGDPLCAGLAEPPVVDTLVRARRYLERYASGQKSHGVTHDLIYDLLARAEAQKRALDRVNEVLEGWNDPTGQTSFEFMVGQGYAAQMRSALEVR